MSASVTEPKKNTSKKVKALLAGGLVLGVGAAVTLAAWTDQEWAEGLFTTGSFNIESSVDGTTFGDNETQDGAAVLEFDLTGADNMAPNETVAAPFVLRLDDTTTYDATVALETAAADGVNAGELTYGIVQVDDAAGCTPDAAGTGTIVPAGTAMNSVEGATDFDLTAGADGAAGEAVTLCFQVASGADLEEGATTTANWQFIGTSVE
ncbi:MAG TPA: SipW-dependent-type signal peptide-containing protein [Enteractinococcus sp.]